MKTDTPPTSDAIAPSDDSIWTADPIEALTRIEKMGGPASYIARECLKRAREIAAQHGDGGPVDDPDICKDIPDWAIAKSYRSEVGKLNPDYRQSALIFASNVTVAADHLARGVKTQYPYNPAQLAQWLRIHHRSSWDKPEYRIPEIVWIYETLLQLPPSITPDQMKDSPPQAADALDGVPTIRFNGDSVEAVVQHLLTAGYTCDGDYEDFFMGVKNAMESAIAARAEAGGSK